MKINKEALRKPFNAELVKTLRKGGKPLSYVSGQHYVERANDAFGPDGWKFRILSVDRHGDDIVVRGVVALVGEPENAAFREQFGGAKVRKGMDLGDVYKTASTDCLKKCLSLFGIGRDLYSDDEFEAFDEGDVEEPDRPKEKKSEGAKRASSTQRKQLIAWSGNNRIKDSYRAAAARLVEDPDTTYDKAMEALEKLKEHAKKVDEEIAESAKREVMAR